MRDLARPLVLSFASLATLLPAQIANWAVPKQPRGMNLSNNQAMAYDSARQRMVLFVGLGTNETWEHDGLSWTRRSPSTTPRGLRVAMVYDSRRGVIVLCSPNNTLTQFETWEWDGVDWTRVLTPSAPGPRDLAAVAYDNGRGVTVLFGGRSSGSPLADTWEYDGADWVQRGSGGPAPRFDHAMAYDERRQRVILFGGHQTLTNPFGDTWEWNGSYWFEHFGISGPESRTRHAMSYDSDRQRVVLFGGTRGVEAFGDTHEFDGQQWTTVTTLQVPPPRGSMAYDLTRDVTVLVNGTSPAMHWELRHLTPVTAALTAFGNGCVGSAGVPALAAQGTSLPVIGTNLDLQVTGVSASVFTSAFALVGRSNAQWGVTPLPFDLTPIGMPGCTLYTSVDAIRPMPHAGGVATWSVSIPFEGGLLGARLYFQSFLIDLGATPLGLTASNGLEAVLGL